MTAAQTSKKDRYPGIRSFEVEDERLFYGRTKEIDDLFSLVVIKPIVVFFGKSGLGKSSLLKAGLGPVLLKNHFFPIMLRIQDTSVSPIDALLGELQPFIVQKQLKKFGGKSTNKVWEAINACSFTGPDGNLATPVLIFDQFEELFNHKKTVRSEWARQLSDLVERRLPTDLVETLQQIPRRQRTPEQLDWFHPPAVKILFAIRSDRMSELHQLRDGIPSILQNRYELKPLQSARSGEAIERPAVLIGKEFTTLPFTYAAETVQEIQGNLSNEDGEIESFQLQIVCQHIEKKVKELESEGKHNIQVTPDFLGGQEGIRHILKNYYDNHVKNLGTKENQLAARKLLEEGLIADARRIGVAEAVVQGTYGVDDILLEKLLESRLIRPENTRLGRTYEISHDTLVAPILEAYDKRRLNEERIAREKELEEQQQQLAIARKKRRFSKRIAIFAFFIALIAIASALFSFFQFRKAERAQIVALIATSAAEKSDALSQQILDALYFFGDSLALASKIEYGRNIYGFINKKGELLIDYQYEEALPFDDKTGYARVAKNGENYLLWPDNTEYQLADKLQELKPGITALDLPDSFLKTIPESIYKQHQLTILLLRGNALENLSRDIEKLSNLRVLNLTKNRFKKLPAQIGNLKSLEQLYLGYNQLENLHPKFGELLNLQRLNLNTNSLTSLPAEMGNLLSLSHLDLSYNNLNSLPPEFAALVNLHELNLSFNKLLSFPSEIGKLVNLKVLNINHLGLTDFPSEIANLLLLEELDLGGNKLESLPPEIEKLQNLKELFLYNNSIKNLPHEIGSLARLKELNLENNSLESLPAEIGNLVELKGLFLSLNNLSTLPPEIGKLTNLERLKLGQYPLIGLPPEFGKLTMLKELHLIDLNLTSIPVEIFSLENLLELNLRKNLLQSLPAKIGQLIRLNKLILVGNKLKELPANISNLINLNELGLSDNLLENLPIQIGELVHLRRLDLSNNNLSEIPLEIGELRNLRFLSLTNNNVLLDNIKSEINKLGNLETLYLSNNSLDNLPYEIGELQNLRTLTLRGNKLKKLPLEMAKLENLRLLDLRENLISSEEEQRIKKLLPNCRIIFR